jgi:hypothetical protein
VKIRDCFDYLEGVFVRLDDFLWPGDWHGGIRLLMTTALISAVILTAAYIVILTAP